MTKDEKENMLVNLMTNSAVQHVHDDNSVLDRLKTVGRHEGKFQSLMNYYKIPAIDKSFPFLILLYIIISSLLNIKEVRLTSVIYSALFVIYYIYLYHYIIFKYYILPYNIIPIILLYIYYYYVITIDF